MVVIPLGISACSSSGSPTPSSTVLSTSIPKGPVTLTVARSQEFVFPPATASAYWNGAVKAFTAKYPNVTIKQIIIPGGYTDLVTKLSLLYSRPGTAPDVAQLPEAGIGQWAAAGYLQPLNGWLGETSWWRNFPPLVRGFGTLNGHTYSVSQGENTTGLYYNIPMFKKAGIPVPWQPKTWNDILSAARMIKAAVPGVSPVWLQGGTEAGVSGAVYGIHNMILGTANPNIYDPTTKKWIVDSPGIRNALQFYSTLAKQGLQANPADLLNANAIINAPQVVSQQKVAIVIGSNWFAPCWTTYHCPAWSAARATMGVAKLPTQFGQAPYYASSATGWALAISATSANKELAWQFVNMLNQKKWAIEAANGAELVPSNREYQADPVYLSNSQPFNGEFAPILSYSKAFPNLAAAPIWAQGINIATGQIIQHPGTSVSQALQTFKSYVTGQVGAAHVESQS